MNKRSIAFVLLFLFLAFTYGLMVGHFRVFPFYQMIDLKNAASEIISSGNGTQSESAQVARQVDVLETSLQRLLLKKIPLYYDDQKQIERSGAIGNSGYDTFINANLDNVNKEFIQVYNLEDLFQYRGDSIKVPMNYEKLLSSPLVEIENFDLFRFRVSDLHIEENEDESQTLYATHHVFEEDKNCISLNISKIDFLIDDKEITLESDWKHLFRAEPCIYPEQNVDYANPFPGHMESGKIVEYDDTAFLVSVGSFSDDPDLYQSLPMDSTSSFGKILLIDKLSGESRIFARGIRNTQGIIRDSDGTLWSTDMGPQGGDELNILEEGNNYGWPMETYGINYGNREWPYANEQGTHDSYDKPAFVWIPSVSPTGIIQISGKKFSLWNEDLLIASLSGTSLIRVRTGDSNQVMYSEKIDIDERIRDILTLPDQKIVLLLDDSSIMVIDDGGAVYRDLGPDIEARMTALDLFDQLISDGNDNMIAERNLTAQSIYAQNCSSCHYENETNDIGPHLKDLYGREVGGLSDFNYSYVLQQSEKQWSPELLKSFLLDPEDTFPNSSMPNVTLTEAEADSIAKYLQK